MASSTHAFGVGLTLMMGIPRSRSVGGYLKFWPLNLGKHENSGANIQIKDLKEEEDRIVKRIVDTWGPQETRSLHSQFMHNQTNMAHETWVQSCTPSHHSVLISHDLLQPRTEWNSSAPNIWEIGQTQTFCYEITIYLTVTSRIMDINLRVAHGAWSGLIYYPKLLKVNVPMGADEHVSHG